jgi:hypothetical protein
MPRLSSFSSRGLTGIGIITAIAAPIPEIVPTSTPANQIITAWDPRTNSMITRPTGFSVTEFFVSNGDTWQSRTLPQLYLPQTSNIQYINGHVYAFVRTDSATFTRDLYRSTDYQNWNLVFSPGINSNWRVDVNVDTGRLLATSGLGTTVAATSTDGSGWTLVNLPAAAADLRFGNKGWNGATIVASNSGNSSEHLYRSTDNGANWSPVATSTTWSSVAQNIRQLTQSVANSGSRFIALLGQGARHMSISTDDGATWTIPQVNTQWAEFASQIFFSKVKNKFIVTNAGSNANVVSYSTDGEFGNWSTTSTLSANVNIIVESSAKVYGSSVGGDIVDLTDLI